MVIVSKMRRVSFYIASLGGLGEWSIGGVLASLLAFPCLLIGRLFYNFSHSFFYWTVLVFLIFSFLIISLSLAVLSEKELPMSAVVWDKIVGMIVAFLFVPLQWKIIFFGFVLFHMINFLRPIIFCKTLAVKIENFPAGLGILVGAIASGIICNIFLHLIVWVIC